MATVITKTKQFCLFRNKMSGLSGYDSEVVGFDSISSNTNPKATSSSQTTEYSETGAASQTSVSKDFGCMAQPYEINSEDILTDYPPPGLNEFLRRVVPGIMEQLNENDKDFLNNSSESDEEESIVAKLVQEIPLKYHTGYGDHESSVLGVCWSSGGNSFAISIGQMVHDTWCQNSGIIKVYTFKRSEGAFAPAFDISEKNCVTVLKYHPTIAALLAYGTTSGEVVLCNLMDGTSEGMQLTSPAGCHGARRVSCLHWAETSVANLFLLIQIKNKNKRRAASDQVLITSGSNGTINAWQVNSNQKVFENIICYTLNGSRKSDTPDITCFDFIKTYPLRPSDERVAEDIFVVGTKTGKLFLCKAKDTADPVIDELEGHGTCVLDVAFNAQRPGIFVSVAMDSELRVYDASQGSPLKVIYTDIAISCMSWLQPPCVVVGLASGEDRLRVYNTASGRVVPITGFSGRGEVTCVTVTQKGLRIAAGDNNGTVRIWELPTHRNKLSNENWI